LIATVIARRKATKQSILSLLRRNGLLRGACHRARIRATRWLATTVWARSPLFVPAPNGEFFEPDQADATCPVLLGKIFPFAIPQIKSITRAIPAHTEGRFAIVTNVGQGCGGRGGALTNAPASGQRSRVVLTPRRWRQVCGAIRVRRWQESPVTGESTKETVKTIRVRECRVIPALPVVTTLVWFLFFPREATGAAGTRHSPRPLLRGGYLWQQLGRNLRRGVAVVCPDLIASQGRRQWVA